MQKMSQKRQKKQISSFFLAPNYLNKLIQWGGKNGFKCFKMHSNTYSPKGPQNGKKWQKMSENYK